ncbi:MAG: Uma2 family endonuclease [Chloroflexota bacterium]
MTLKRRHGGGPRPVYYPETDGKPMAESDQHRDEMLRLISTLKDAFPLPDVYVSGNLLIYYEEGNPRASVAPDVFVVLGVPSHRRLIYKLWKEGVPPTFVIEVTSPSTRREDQARKRALYARLGVAEYVMYDPLAEYLRPPLQGYRLEEGDYRAMPVDDQSRLVSEALNLRLTLQGGALVLFNPITGARLLSAGERADAEAQRADPAAERAASERQRADTEAAARRAADRRIAELEALLRAREEER